MPRKPKNKIHLNDRVVEGLESIEGTTRYYDEAVGGLQLVCYRDGSKVWACRPKLRDGRHRLITIGPWCRRGGIKDQECLRTTKARGLYVELLADVRRGAYAEKDTGGAPGETFEAVTSRYFAHHQRLVERRSSNRKRVRTLKEERRVLDTDILPGVCEGRLVAEMSVKEIRPKHLIEVLAKIQQRGSLVMRDRARAYTSNIFRFALGEGLIEMNPVTAVPKTVREKPRDRRFSKDELKTLLDLWMGRQPLSGDPQSYPSPPTPYFFVLGILTLARRDEIRMMEWARIKPDGEQWFWHVPVEVKMPDGQVYELVKNKLEHRIPLSRFAREILENRLRPLTGEHRWVFPGPRRPDWPRSRSGFQKSKRRYIREASIEDMRIHDLRSIGATILAELGVSEEIIGLCCNHKPRTITSRVYIRSQERNMSQRIEALERLGEYVRQLSLGQVERANA